MAEGGLNYKLDVSGNFDAVLRQFEARIDALSGKVKSLKGKNTDVGPEAGGSRSRIKELTAEEAVLKRLLKARREIQILSDRELRGANTKAAAAQREAAAYTRRAAQRTQLNNLIDKDIKNEKELSKLSGVGVTRIRQLVPEYQKAADLMKQQALSAKEKAKAEAFAKKSQERIAKEQKRISDYNNVGLQATNRNAEAARELAIKKAQINQLTKSGAMSQRAAAEQVGLTSAQAKQLKLNMWDAGHAARQFLFTFRRLVGILAIFTAARKLAQALAMGVKEMSRFNAELETAEIGIASIVASIAQVRDAQGNLVTGADAFAASLEASEGILNQIKKDAVGSIATFEALVQAYQVAIGPGLTAGLDLDQIRVLSRRLAEGAVSLGVPLNQLSEEIRSLLQGTATARNTRIAALFGGAKEANEAVRNAREQGNLYETLMDKLKGVAQGADAATSSFKVLQSNLQDAVQLLLAEGGLERFESLKEAMQGLTQSMMDTSGEDIVFNQAALGLVQEVAGTLAEVVRSFRELTDTASVFATLRNAVGAVGDVLKALAPAAAAIFQGMIDGVNTLLAPVRLLGVGLRAVARALGIQTVNKSLAEVLKVIVQIVVAVTIWHRLTQAITKMYASGKVFEGLRLGFMYAAQTAAALKVQGVSLVKITSLTAIWNALMTGVATKAAIAGGLWTLLAIAIAVVAVKLGWIDKAISLYNKKVTKSVSLTDELGASFSGAADTLGDIRSELADIDSQVKSMAEENQLKRALMLVSDTARDTLEMYLKRDQAIADATKTQNAAIAKEKELLAVIKEQLDTVNERISSNAGRRGMIKTDLVDNELLQDAQKRMGLWEQETAAVREITIREQQKKEIIADINRRTAGQIERKRIEMEQEQRLRTIKLEQLDAAGKLEAAQARALGAAFADQVQARVKLDIIKEQKEVLLEQIDATDKAIKKLRIDIKPEDAVSAATDAIAELEAQLNALEEPKILNIEIEKGAIQKDLDAVNKELAKKRAVNVFGAPMDTAQGAAERAKLLEEQKKLQADLNSLKESGLTKEQAVAQELYDEQRSLLEQKKARAEEDLTGARLMVKEQKQLIKLKQNEQIRALSKQKELDAEAIAAQREAEMTSLAASQQFTDGVRLGLIEFVDSVGPVGEEISEVVTSALTDLSSTVASVFKDAIDPRKDADLRTAFGEFFLNLAGDFVQAITQQLIAQAVGGLLNIGGTVAADSALIASQASLTAATNALTLAMGGDIAATNANTSGLFSNTGATIKDTVATIYNTIATKLNSLWLQIKSYFAKGGLVGGYAKGGQIKGYAVGGDIPRPSHIPASDTVPAWLTPGEFVIKRSSVQKYGTGLLDKLNRGQLPSSFYEAGHSLKRTSSAVQHFASGGNVSPASVTASPERTSQTIVLPVMPANDTTVDQMLTGGRKAFDRKVNQSPKVGDPNASKRW